jgi:hypothetical protein
VPTKGMILGCTAVHFSGVVNPPHAVKSQKHLDSTECSIVTVVDLRSSLEVRFVNLPLKGNSNGFTRLAHCLLGFGAVGEVFLLCASRGDSGGLCTGCLSL